MRFQANSGLHNRTHKALLCYPETDTWTGDMISALHTDTRLARASSIFPRWTTMLSDREWLTTSLFERSSTTPRVLSSCVCVTWIRRIEFSYSERLLHDVEQGTSWERLISRDDTAVCDSNLKVSLSQKSPTILRRLDIRVKNISLRRICRDRQSLRRTHLSQHFSTTSKKYARKMTRKKFRESNIRLTQQHQGERVNEYARETR